MAGKHVKDEYSRPQGGNYNSINKNTKRKEIRKTNKFDAILRVLGFIYVVITIIFFISIVKMNIVPTLYLIIFAIAEIIFTLLMAVGLVKKRKSYRINLICIIIIVVVSFIYINATQYVLATIDFLGTMFSQSVETENYYVVVHKDSKFLKIEDIKGKEISIFQVESDIKEEINSKVDVTLKTKDSLTQMGNSILENENDIILVSSAQYNMLSDEIDNFKDNTKIIYTATHNIQVKPNSNLNSKHTIDSGIFNVYISGMDTYGSINNVARSDANIVATVNANTHEVLLTSIPRDYYVTLHSKKAKDKLTHSGIYGINETVTTVEDLLDVDINYYVRVNFSTLIKVIDTVGGIEVYSDYNFSQGGYYFKKGYNNLNGEAALIFSRERYSFENGDNQRVKNQQYVIEAIIKKVMNSTTILTKYTDILNSLEGSFQTNIEQKEISKLVKEQIEKMSSWTIKSNSLTGTSADCATYSMGSQKLYVMIPDTTSVEGAKNKIKDMME